MCALHFIPSSVSDGHYIGCYLSYINILVFLFIKATIGVNETKKPGMMDFVGKAKWDAWSSLGSMSQVTLC